MTNYTWPTFAKVTEFRFGIRAPTPDQLLVSRLTNPMSSPLSEMWGGTIVLAPMTRPQWGEFQAFLDTLDGRADSILFPVSDFRRGIAAVASLVADVPAGAGEVRLAFASTGLTLLAGALIGIGNTALGTYQLHEVIEDAVTGSDVAVKIAPRVRWARASGALALVNAADAKLKLASDNSRSGSISVSHGVITVDVVESFG